MLLVFILAIIIIALCVFGIILDIFCEKMGWFAMGSIVILVFFVGIANKSIQEYNTVYTITTHYLDKDVSYPIEIEVIRTEKAAIKHQEEIAEKLYTDLNRVDDTWTIVTKENNIIVSNRKKYYIFYMVPCKIKSK